jgi:hypothetical protein
MIKALNLSLKAAEQDLEALYGEWHALEAETAAALDEYTGGQGMV